MWLKSVPIALLFLVCLPCAHGQRFQSLNKSHPFAEVYKTYQDSFGFLWFGTKDGLVKYDGYTTTQYQRIPGDSTSLPGSDVISILQVSDTTLLIGFMMHGLWTFNRNTAQCEPLPLVRKKDQVHVYALKRDSQNRVWAGTNAGLFTIIHDSITRFTASANRSDHGLTDNTVLELFEDNRGNLWIGTLAGLHRLPKGSHLIENPYTHPEFPNERVLSIRENSHGQVWVSVLEGDCKMFVWEPGQDCFTPDQRFLRDGEFRFVFGLGDRMWTSSHARGVYAINQDGETFYSADKYREHGLMAMFTNGITIDKYHNVWIEGDEVYQFPGSGKSFYSIEGDGFQVISVFADEDYIWYCASEPYRWSRSAGTTEAYMSDMKFTELVNPDRARDHKRIYDYQPWGDSLIFSSIRNFFIWNRKTDAYTEYPTTLPGAFREFILDDVSQVWFPGHHGKPGKLDLLTGEYASIPEMSEMHTVISVDQSADGTQWWGNSMHGVFSFDSKTKESMQYIPDPDQPDQSLTSFSVNDILCHSDGSIWAGTKLGLNRIDPETGIVTPNTFDSYSVNKHITSLVEDKMGTIWMGTQQGLLNFDPATGSLRHFTRSDGLLNTSFTTRACFRDTGGWLYFGGDRGIDYFNPEEIGSNPVPPDLYIKSIHVNNALVFENISGECLKQVEFSPDENFIEIELVAVHLVAPQSNTYAYRLAPQQAEWISLGTNRSISFAGLKPGMYHLEGKAANPDGVWSEPRTLLQMHILPPFWQTAWFYLLAGGLIACFVYLVYRIRVYQIRKSEQLKTEFNKRIAEIEMKALRAQMNPHFLFNSLNSVRLLIDKGNNTEAKIYLTKYSHLIRMILQNSRSKLIRLEEELEVIQLYLELEKMRFKNFNFRIAVDSDVEVDFIEIPPLLLQPYVENAIWHGLMPLQSRERNLDIRVRRNIENIEIEIEDNGIGRERSRKLKTGSRVKEESLGMKISEDRLRLLKDLYGTDASVEVLDLLNPAGTIVRILLPASPE